MIRWRVPRIWPDSTVFVVGGGPSLTMEQLETLRQHKAEGHYRVLGINKAFELGGWVDAVYFGDKKYYDKFRKKMVQFYPGLLVSTVPQCERDRYVKYVGKDRKKRHGISERPDAICWNKNSGCSGINLAYLFGATHIILLGFDMAPMPDPTPIKTTTKKGEDRPKATHWHDGYPEFGRPSRDETGKPPTKLPYNRYLKVIPQIAKDAKRLGLQITDCSLKGQIKHWSKRSVEELIEEEVIRCRENCKDSKGQGQ